jgi:hypothetical protein
MMMTTTLEMMAVATMALTTLGKGKDQCNAQDSVYTTIATVLAIVTITHHIVHAVTPKQRDVVVGPSSVQSDEQTMTSDVHILTSSCASLLHSS